MAGIQTWKKMLERILTTDNEEKPLSGISERFKHQQTCNWIPNIIYNLLI